MKLLGTNSLTITLLSSFISLSSTAQRLPNKQTGSVYLTNSIKIDGKFADWGNKFNAYNHNVDLYYSLANDDDNLYLLIQARDKEIINKVVSGGITLTIDTGGKISKNPVKITYPIFINENKANVYLINKFNSPPKTEERNKELYRYMLSNNKRLTQAAKYIMVTGIEAIDTIISVFNENGIKAAAAFDSRLFYTQEISLSLKILGGNKFQKLNKLRYRITLNGVDLNNMNGIKIENYPDGKFKSLKISDGAILPSEDQINAMISSTDFQGVYFLKKQ